MVVACKQHIGGLRSSLVVYGQVWWHMDKFWSTVKFGSVMGVRLRSLC